VRRRAEFDSERAVASRHVTGRPNVTIEPGAAALARLYDLDLVEEPGDLDLYRALARRTGGPIVELAIGTGRIAVPLAEEGHRVVGVDLDAAMLDRARMRANAAGSAAPSIELVECDLVDAWADTRVTAAGPYRLAILGLNSILMLASASRQRAALASMARLLAPGGLAVVDAWQPTPADLMAFDGRLSLEWLRTDLETGREVTKTVAAWHDPIRRLVTLTTMFDEGEPGSAPVRWTRSDALRLINADELSAFAGEAGLEIEQLAGDHELGPPDAGSDRVVLVARKPGSAGGP
jgi:SAM-dependent methyltransferase